jgi:hypothetical protein
MGNVVTFIMTFTTIFYFKKFELGKVLFGSVKVDRFRISFESIWIRISNQINRRRPHSGRGPTHQRPCLPCFGVRLRTHAPPAWSHRSWAAADRAPPRCRLLTVAGAPPAPPPPLSAATWRPSPSVPHPTVSL